MVDGVHPCKDVERAGQDELWIFVAADAVLLKILDQPVGARVMLNKFCKIKIHNFLQQF